MGYSYFTIAHMSVNDTSGFGRVPDPPEPLPDEWFEENCPKCKNYHEYKENGKWYSECTVRDCEFEEGEEN